MKKRNPIAVLILPFITLGIYGLVWQVKTKNEMNSQGASIPTAWLIIVPFVSLWWLWKYSQGVDKVTNQNMSDIVSFLLLVFLGPIGMAVIQNSFNQVGAATASPSAPAFDTPVPNPNPAPAPAVIGTTPAPTVSPAPAPAPTPVPPASPTPQADVTPPTSPTPPQPPQNPQPPVNIQ